MYFLPPADNSAYRTWRVWFPCVVPLRWRRQSSAVGVGIDPALPAKEVRRRSRTGSYPVGLTGCGRTPRLTSAENYENF